MFERIISPSRLTSKLLIMLCHLFPWYREKSLFDSRQKRSGAAPEPARNGHYLLGRAPAVQLP